MDPAAKVRDQVLERCRSLGFALAGICRAEPTDYKAELLDWLAAGKHGEMEYLNRNVQLRVDPRAMVPAAKSIVFVADRYSATESASAPGGNPQPAAFQGRIARYARGEDYHVVMRKRLTKLARELANEHPDETFRVCVDTAPVLEREHAQRAGLGAVGKNTLLLQRGVGSYLLLGEIITTLPLPPSEPAEPDPCSTCTRCIDACPTDAISPWSVDATKCISYLTIEHRSEIDPKYHSAIGDWIFGCDVCQEVCPHNQPTSRSLPQTAAIYPAYQTRSAGFDLLEILKWDEESRRQAFAKSSMKRAKLNMMKRNALIAAGNALRHTANEALRLRIESLANDPAEDPLVRNTARTVLQSLTPKT